MMISPRGCIKEEGNPPCSASPSAKSLPSYRTETWMHDLHQFISGCSMSELKLLGTHNSATYAIEDDSVLSTERASLDNLWARKTARHVTAKWSKCQSRTIFQQLCDGVRYLDLRVAPINTGNVSVPLLWIVHGMYSVSLREAFGGILSFFSGTPSPWSLDDSPVSREDEVVIVDVQQVLEWDRPGVAPILDAEFLRELDVLKPLLVSKPFGVVTPLAQLYEQRHGKNRSSRQQDDGTCSAPSHHHDEPSRCNVIVLYPRPSVVKTHSILHLRTKATVRSPWYGESKPKTLFERISNDIARELSSSSTVPSPSQRDSHGASVDSVCSSNDTPVTSPGSPSYVGVMQTILTPTTADVVRGIVSPFQSSCQSILDFAVRINSRALSFWLKYCRDTTNRMFLHHDEQCVDSYHANVLLLDFYEVGGVQFSLGGDSNTARALPRGAAKICIELNLLQQQFAPKSDGGAAVDTQCSESQYGR